MALADSVGPISVDDKPKLVLKVVVIGNSRVGKTSLAVRYSTREFSTSISTMVSVDFWSKRLEIDGRKVTLRIWDTAGQERYDAVRAPYYRDANAVLVVYDCGSLESFDAVQKRWMPELIRQGLEAVPTFIVCSKVDQPEDKREVSQEEGRHLAQELGGELWETSAMDGQGVDDLFAAATSAMLALQPPELVENPGRDTMSLKLAAGPKKQCWC